MKLVALAQQGISFNDIDRLGNIPLAKLDLPIETFSNRNLDRSPMMTGDSLRKSDRDEIPMNFSDYDRLFDRYVRDREGNSETPLLHRK